VNVKRIQIHISSHQACKIKLQSFFLEIFMKRHVLLATLLCSLTMSSAFAQYEREHYEHDFDHRPHPDAHWHPGTGWVVPAIVGGALVYGAYNSRPVVTETVPVQNYPVQINQPQVPPPGYHWEQILDDGCRCNRVVLVRNY
jgi:hypothetical protein